MPTTVTIKHNEYGDCSGGCTFFHPHDDIGWHCILGLDTDEVPTDRCPGPGKYKLTLEVVE